MVLGLVIVLALLVGAFILFSGDTSEAQALFGGYDIAAYVMAGLLAVYVVFLLGGYGGRIGQAIRHLSIWAALMLAAIVAYAYRDEVSIVANRVAGEFLPPGTAVEVEPRNKGERAVRLRKRRDGHFVARASVNGAALALLVDTGASTVVLRPVDAARAGIDVDKLTYTVAVNTANGIAYAAPVRLRAISIGGIEITNVDALVAKPGGLGESLLGMSFLRRLRSFDFSGDFLTLRG
ncbi:MAG: TIGR02281 family clan AA aspartic protease [Hyphomicrobiaceae bacterium]|nr:TIGR02281 family clan AA aspartic protease [Hyphomicrobiaceae bacterium]